MKIFHFNKISWVYLQPTNTQHDCKYACTTTMDYFNLCLRVYFMTQASFYDVNGCRPFFHVEVC